MNGTRFRAGAKLMLSMIVVFVLAFMVVEGCSSLVLLSHDLTAGRNTGPPIRAHMQPDTLLGWVNTPGTRDPDMFGAGIGLNINSSSFRGTREYAAATPAGRTRVVCSGDSFTFGYGVADTSSWCAILEQIDPALETVNFGHTGWGIDQSYLFYRRAAPALEHQLHLFAFIQDDVRRLRLNRFNGYPKPFYRLEDNELQLNNVPVSTPSRLQLWYTYNHGTIWSARSLDLGRRVLARLAPDASSAGTATVDEREIMVRLLERVAADTRANGATLVVVFLEENVTATAWDRRLRDRIETELAARQIPFIDLWSEFRRMPSDSLAAAFDPRWRHYTADANAKAARSIHDRLVDLDLIGAH